MQHLKIPVHVMDFDRGEPHAAFDPAPQRALFVKGEIMGSLREQKIDNLRQSIVRVFLRTQTALPALRCQSRAVSSKCTGYFCYRKHQIHQAGQDRVLRHAVIASLVGILCDDQAAVFPDRFQANAAVRAGAGKNHGDGARSAIRRQRV